MGISFIRTVILFIFVVIALRIMGKRQLGELQPSELVVAIMISDLATVPMQSRDIPLIDGIIPIFTLVVLELLISALVLKSEKLRSLITGRPTIIIEKGKFIPRALSSLRLSIDDITEQLRLAGYTDISQVDSAIIETNGQISILPKESERPLTCGDMNLNPSQSYMPYSVISDGKLRIKNLKALGLTEGWLRQVLSANNITDAEDVFYMSVTSDRKVFIQKKE